MMNFFPMPYDDELFYSMISRKKQMCGMISKKAFIRDIYNKNVYPKSIFFPQYLDSIVSNLPVSSQLDTEYFILKSTMFPLFTAFISPEKSKRIYKYMSEGSTSNVERLVGILGSKISMNKFLRYCPLCFKEDTDRFGESYWRRLHQVPGVLYCIEHQVELVNSIVLATHSQCDYICADFDSCRDISTNSVGYLTFYDLNKKFIDNASYLLTTNVNRKSLEFITDFYIDKLRERKLASARGNIYMKKLQHEFIEFYSHEYLTVMKCDIDIDDETNWLRLFVRNNNKNRSFLKHLMFLQFLGIEPRELFNCESVTGKTPSTRIIIPKYKRKDMRQKWLKIVRDNPGASRCDLKRIGKGVHTWIFRHDREWYEKVSPAKREKVGNSVGADWNARDEECLELAKRAVKSLLGRPGKPIRITGEAIRRETAGNRWFSSSKLVKTRKYIKDITEDIDSFRLRKIRWAIAEMEWKGLKVTPYKVQLYAGFGGKNKEARALIEEELLLN